jgi:hypothetical protein
MNRPLTSLHLPSEVFVALITHTGELYYGDKSEAVLSALIRKWIAATEPVSGNLRAALAEAAQSEAASAKGYQWKQLFLPNGTELRVTFHGRSTYAKVENEKIICDGASITPSQLANANGCGTRNAWRAIWLRFPGTTRWELAARLRNAQGD